MFIHILHSCNEFVWFIINITYVQQVDRENIKKLSKKIKKLRLEKSKSLNKFVISNGYLTTATWSRLENGITDYKYSTLLRGLLFIEYKNRRITKRNRF